MAPRYRPVARLRLRVRRRVQNVVGIITGQHPGESTSVEQYYASTCTSSTTRSSSASSSSFGTSSNPPRIFRRQQQQRRYSQLSRSKASYHSLTSINESDEDSLVDGASTRTPSSGMSSANVSVFDSDSDDYDDDDDDEDDDGFEDTDSEISSISEGHDGRKPSNPFSDYYSSPATTTGVTTIEEGAELTRVHARGDKPTPLQRRRANDPYNTQVRLDGVSSSRGAASARTRVQRVTLPKGMKWKSTPGAFYGFTSSGGTTAGRNSSRKAGKNGFSGSGPSTPPSASSPSRTATAAAPRPRNAKIIEIPWNHTAHGAYQTLRPADRKSVRSWTSGAIAAGGIDAGTMMAMMECHTPACDMLLPLPSTAASSYGYASSRGGAASRLAEFDGLAGLAYGGGGLGEADMQWLEYMSIPSGSLGKASRWVGRRLGLCSSSTSSSSGSGSTSIGCSAGSRNGAGGVAHAGVGPLGGKPSLLKTATEGSKGGVVSQLAAPGAAAVRVVSAKRVRFA